MSNFFHSDCNITDGMYKGVGGWFGGGGVAGVGGKPKAGQPYHQESHSSRVRPVSGTDSHNPQDRPGQSLATVWHHTHPY